jgi:hypothetical protein
LSYIDLSNPDEFNHADAKYVDDFSPVVNGGYRRCPPSAYWLERIGCTHEFIQEIREKVAQGVSCRSLVHQYRYPINVIQFMISGKHPDFPEPVIVPDELKPKRGRKKHGENKVLDKYRKELTTYQEEAILAALKQLLVDGETEIAIRFPAFVLPPVWWPACERTSRGGHNNNFFYPLTRWYRVKKLLLSFSKADKVLMTEQEINLIYKQAKKMKEKLDV